MRLTRNTRRRAKLFYASSSSRKAYTGPAKVIDHLADDDILVIEFDRSGGIGIHRHADLEPA